MKGEFPARTQFEPSSPAIDARALFLSCRGPALVLARFHTQSPTGLIRRGIGIPAEEDIAGTAAGSRAGGDGRRLAHVARSSPAREAATL